MSWDYDDIIDLPHHVSDTRRPMSMDARAAQFAPFAALNTHAESLAEAGRLTDSRVELTDDEKMELSAIIDYLITHRKEKIPARIIYFIHDPQKDGGHYVAIEGVVKRFDECERQLILTDGTPIPLADLFLITPAVVLPTHGQDVTSSSSRDEAVPPDTPRAAADYMSVVDVEKDNQSLFRLILTALTPWKS